MAGRLQHVGGEQQASDHDDVEQAGRRGGGREPAERIQNRAHQRGERDEPQIGEGQPRHLHGEIEALRLVGKAGGEQPDQRRHGELGSDGDEGEHDDHQGQHALGEGARRCRSQLGAQAGEHRHEAGIEGAFGEQAAKEVRQAEGDEERVGYRPGAENAGDRQVTEEA